jgi:hypothetical protein
VVKKKTRRCVATIEMETNSPTTNCLLRSKKLPPPPLCLPATNTTTDEENISNSNRQRERKRSANNCCLSSSTDDCSHQSISYILPASQRPQILETLIASSSVLLAPSSLETKHKKSSTAASVNQINLLKQRRSSSKVTITDAEWIEFMRLILYKPLERELKLLLDKYKMTYFDRINVPNTADDTVRSSLCTMVAEALAAYSSSSISPSTTTDDLATNISSPISTTTTTNNGSEKRKRKSHSTSLSISTSMTINNQTKFVVSYIIPGKYDTTNNGNKPTNQPQQKQFQKKYSHLFRYIPDKDVQEYLIREDHLKSNSISSRSPNNNSICLMLYDEVIIHMDEYDLDLSGITLDDSFTLPESILTQINSSIQ